MFGFSLMFPSRASNLNLGGGSGGDPKDKLMVAGLAVIIIGAIVAVVMSVVGGGSGSSGPESVHFKCLNEEYCRETCTEHSQCRIGFMCQSGECIDPTK